MVNVNDRVFKSVETRGKGSNRGVVVITLKFCSTRLSFDTINVEFLSLNGVFIQVKLIGAPHQNLSIKEYGSLFYEIHRILAVLFSLGPKL